VECDSRQKKNYPQKEKILEKSDDAERKGIVPDDDLDVDHQQAEGNTTTSGWTR